ncbi:carboxypeptidase-like regulatory domain-containing protein [Sinomicrobium oceani]|uniref:carboxypeptidase-like regulatory domain-containing protein n=1 Tax=Sinomicrobium oceani TaxID=1150368 RepID=UPI00227CCC75|nr:carboxypeptidase-like regulatory domain-containing protein [Sinomicrobium oceani]
MYLQNSENQRKVRQVMLGLVLLLFGSFSYGQHITVSGMVSDANGPLPGASIIVQGTSNGTTTDFDGKYSLGDVPSDAVLEISYIGYKKSECLSMAVLRSTLHSKKTWHNSMKWSSWVTVHSPEEWLPELLSL